MRDDPNRPLRVGDRVTLSFGLYAGIDGVVMEVLHTVRPWVGRARLRLPCPHSEYWHPFWSDPMDEAEWPTTTDTAAMERYLQSLQPPDSVRKWRLFAAACARRVWHRILDSRSRRLILLSERYADGKLSQEEYSRITAADRVSPGELEDEYFSRYPHLLSHNFPRAVCHLSVPSYQIRRIATYLGRREEEECSAHRELLRDMFGNPFRPVAIDPEWRDHNDEAVTRLARDIYDDGSFEDMPILADALEDAGGQDEVILAHCRARGLHARGCWLLDLVLGKT